MKDNLIDFQTFKNKIRSFQRDELLHLSTVQCWEGWRREDSSVHKMDSLLFATISPRIFCLTAAVGTNFNRKFPAGYDYLKLVRSYLNVREIEMKTTYTETIEEYLGLLQQSTVLKNLNLNAKHLELVKIVGSMQRMSRPQLERHSYVDPVRGLLIFKEADNIQSGALSERVQTLFNLTSEDFYRSALTIFSLLMDKSGHNSGKVYLDKTFYNEELEIKYGVNLHTLLLCTSRLETNRIQIQHWNETLSSIDDLLKKNYPIPFYDFPLYRVSDDELPFVTGRKNGDYLYICPSPELFLASLKTILFRYVLSSSDAPKDLNILFGDAFENYLFNHCFPNMFRNYKKIGTSDKKSADFLIETEKYNLIIESKKSLNNSVGLNLARPCDIVETWERTFLAIRQCAHSAQELHAQNKTTVAIIVYDQNILNDTNLFLTILDEIGYLQDNAIPYIEVMSVSQFEEIFLRADTDIVLDTIIGNWTKYRDKYDKSEFKTLLNSNIKYTNHAETHLHLEMKSLFPDLPYPSLTTK
jgi:hypothetical protein